MSSPLRAGWPALVLALACSEEPSALDAASGADAGVLDGLAVDRDAAPASDASTPGADASVFDGGAVDASPPGLCRENFTALTGTLDGAPFDFATDRDRSGQGSPRMGHAAIARWFGPGFLYLSSSAALGGAPQPTSAILALPSATASTALSFFCSTAAMGRFYEPQPMNARIEVSLLDLARLGGCPAGPPGPDAFTLCTDPLSQDCFDAGGSPHLAWLSGQLGGETFDEDAGLIGLRDDAGVLLGLARGGRLAFRLAREGALHRGYVVMRGPGPLDPARVWCARARLEGGVPLGTLRFNELSPLAQCATATRAGSLMLCSE